MNGLLHHLGNSLRLHLRNRLALLYGYLFPALFLAAFWVLYRHEPVPLLRHMGELLTVTVLGGACFGLPTILVSERERGVWRRYRLLPVGPWTIVLSTVLARFIILLSAGLLQLALALAAGMTAPEHLLALGVAFTFSAFAFIGLGLVIAMLADNVPAVQALGQCLFLPMLIVGGVAVPLASLPDWAQQVSLFLPGRYSVTALQACVNGGGLAATGFDLFALVIIGTAGFFAGTKLFRWDTGALARTASRLWLLPALAAWVVVGLLAETGGAAAASTAGQAPAMPPRMVAPSKAELSRRATPVSWEAITPADVETLNFTVPPDLGILTPIAMPGNEPDEMTRKVLDEMHRQLPGWPPGQVADPVQRVRNLLSIAAAADLMQDPVESYVPLLVLEHLQAALPPEKLVRLLAWIALHPEEGEVQADLGGLGLGHAGQPAILRERVEIYAIKLLARLTGRPAGPGVQPSINPP